MKLVSLLLFLVSSPALAAPFSPGEKTTFAITYFGATAGILDVEVLPDSTDQGKKRHEYSAKARTDSIFSLFYRLQNEYRSTVDARTELPLRWVATLDESRQEGTTSQDFDQVKKKVRFVDKRTDKKHGKIEKDIMKDFPRETQDVVSAMFHLRALPLEKGKKFDLPVFIGEESCLLKIEVVDTENLTTKIGELPSFVLKPSLLKDGKVSEIPETLVWIAQREDHALLKVKAKVKIGSIIAYLKSFQPGKN